MDTFKALRTYTDGSDVSQRFEQLTLNDIDDGDVVIRTAYSGVNYKDAMAAHGIGRNVRPDPPCVGGVDMSGVVESSEDSRFKPGDPVIVTNHALGVDHDGGYSEIVRVPGDWVVPLPDGLNLCEAMVLGSAGLCAALAVERLEQNGMSPGNGRIAVTGATGGVGSIAIDILAKRGYEVTAITGKTEQSDYLQALGASDILSRAELPQQRRFLGDTLWAGAIDNLGGEMLVWLTKAMQPHSAVALCGLAESAQIPATVMPFILRAVDYLGINISSAMDMPLRRHIWERLATDLKPKHMNNVARMTPFYELPAVFDSLIESNLTGRIVVEIGN
ncbi:MAG: oxidoreductase [Alphaproteobacteria bacterium]|nr:oxidoreductase [Alphaproteobacteria bacterium]|tara:strand:- start:3704 stop:4699 length:996 start_codon:yes stop_codon:yes gene_type:complete